MAIAVPDELQESVGQGTNQALMAVCGRSGIFLQTIARAGVALTESGSDDHVWQHELVSFFLCPRPDSNRHIFKG